MVNVKALCAGLMLLQYAPGSDGACPPLKLESLGLKGEPNAALNVGGCVEGQVLGFNTKCRVECAKGFTTTSTTKDHLYECGANDILTAPKLKCTGECTSVVKGTGERLADPGATTCITNQKLSVGSRCDIQCADGYSNGKGDSFYSCEAATRAPKRSGPACTQQFCPVFTKDMYTTGAVGWPKNEQIGIDVKKTPCTVGSTQLGLKEQCAVKCGLGFLKLSTNPADSFGTCEKDKNGVLVFTKPKLKCEARKCSHTNVNPNGIPYTFAPDVEGGNLPLCLPGSELVGGTSCKIRCKSGFTPVSGNDTFTCNERGELDPATLICGGTSCTLPVNFGSGIVVGASRAGLAAASSLAEGFKSSQKFDLVGFPEAAAQGCVLNGRVQSGSSCSVRCASGFAPRTPVVSSSYDCFGGTINRPDLTCLPSTTVTATFETGSNELSDVELDCLTIRIANRAGFAANKIGAALGASAAGTASTIDVVFTLPLDTSISTAQSFQQAIAGVANSQECALKEERTDPIKDPIKDVTMWNRLVTTSVAVGVCGLQRDSSCFDTIYPCDSCCRSGINIYGLSCWDAVYTPTRCCEGATAAPSSPPVPPVETQAVSTTSAPVPVQGCAKNPGCFDSFYPCSSCCTVGTNVFGQSCWDAVFNAKECCTKPAEAASPTLSPVVPMAFTSTSTPTEVCKYVKDTECFNEFYPCQECCAGSGLSPYYGSSCFDHQYTRARCCSSGVTSGPATPGPAIPEECQDSAALQDVCPAWAQAGECDGGQASWVKSTCPKSCSVACTTGEAAPTSPSSPTAQGSSVCIDTRPECPTWKLSGLCTDVAVSAFMLENCAQSCSAQGCAGRRSQPKVVGLHTDEYGNILDSRNHLLKDMAHHAMAAVFLSADGSFVDSRGRQLPKPSQYVRPGSAPHTAASQEQDSTASTLPISLGVGALVLLALVGSVLMWRRQRRHLGAASQTNSDGQAVTVAV